MGEAGDDNLDGDSGNDLLMGEAGDDTLIGGDGDDVLDGGGGIDRLDGGSGNDTYVVSSNATYTYDGLTSKLGVKIESGGVDRVFEDDNGGTDTVQSTGTFMLPEHVENLEIIGGGSVPAQTSFGESVIDLTAINNTTNYAIGVGNLLGNTITGNQDNNLLMGGAGDDTLHGGEGSDYISGGTGKDTLNGGAGNDILVGNGDVPSPLWEIPSIETSLLWEILSLPEPQTFSNEDVLNGGDGNDTLYGEQGNDLLNGDAGSDALIGYGASSTSSGAEFDTLTGGTGGDAFYLGNKNDNIFYQGSGYATITDFDYLEWDYFVAAGNWLDYSIETSPISGSTDLDTEILYQGDRIAVVQDTTAVNLFLDFVFV